MVILAGETQEPTKRSAEGSKVKVDRQMRGRLIIRCFDNGHEVIRAEGRVLVDDLAAKVLDLLGLRR
jgi:hypothetical protein